MAHGCTHHGGLLDLMPHPHHVTSRDTSQARLTASHPSPQPTPRQASGVLDLSQTLPGLSRPSLLALLHFIYTGRVGGGAEGGGTGGGAGGGAGGDAGGDAVEAVRKL